MNNIFKVTVNDKVVNLQGNFVGNKFCVNLSSVERHPALTQEEKESLKSRLKNDKSLLTK